MNKFLKEKKVLLLGLSSSILILAIFFFGLYPLYNSITTLSQEIYNQRIKLAILKQQRENIEQTRKDYINIKNEIENISKVFVDQKQIIEIIDSLEIIADQNSLIQNISFDSTTELNKDTPITMNINISGDWLNILSYLADIEQLDFYVSLSDLTFNKKDSAVSLAFSANIFSK